MGAFLNTKDFSYAGNALIGSLELIKRARATTKHSVLCPKTTISKVMSTEFMQ